MSLINDDIKERLQALYSAENRFYHTWRHIEHMLALLERWRGIVTYFDLIEAAIYFHDAIYDSRDHDNEEASATLARDWLGGRVSQRRLEIILAMIIATKKHIVEGNRPPETIQDIQFVLDADLSILGASPEQFMEFDSAVRKEYAWVNDVAWKVGRRAVLQGFLDRPRIYKLDCFHEAFEGQARINLAAALKALA